MSTTDRYSETFAEMEEVFGITPPPLDAIAEEDAANEWPAMKKYTLDESEIPAKYRELIGLAIAANIKCPYCSYFHREAAKMHGATDEELKEAFYLASFTPRFSAMLHAQQYDLDEFKEKVEQIAAHLEGQQEKLDQREGRPSPAD